MGLMTYSYWIAAFCFIVIGLLISSLLNLAEKKSYYVKGVKKYKSEGKILYIVIFLILILFAMLHKPGYGMEPYIIIFNSLTSYESNGLFSVAGLYDARQMEPMFMLWCYVIKSITSSSIIFLLITFSYFWICILLFIYNYTTGRKFAITFMAMWPIMIDFTFGIRYGLAICHCLLAMVLFKKRRYFWAAALLIVASFTHFLLFGFALFVGFYFFSTIILKDKVNTVKSVLLLFFGSLVLSRVGYSIYQTFRVAYRANESIETSSILSYTPLVIFALYILINNRGKKLNTGDNICSMASYFNMVMLPVTVLWGIYRLPYVFLLPTIVELNNVMSTTPQRNGYNCLMVAIILIFAFVKIVTMGVQNQSLDYIFVF